MDDDKEKLLLPAPATSNRFSHFVSLVVSRSYYLLLAAACIAIIGGVALPANISTKIEFLFGLLLVTSICIRNKESVWAKLPMRMPTKSELRLAGSDSRGADVQVVHARTMTILRSMLESKDVVVAVAGLFTSCLIAQLIELTMIIGRSGGAANDAALAVCSSLLFPLTAAELMRLRQKIANDELPSTVKSKFALSRAVANLQMPNFSYVCCYAGFTNFALMLSFLPHGVGAQFTGWLNACMRDANFPISTDAPLAMQLVVSTLVFIALMTAFRHAMVRFSAGYQLFLKRAIVFRDPWLDAFRATVQINPIRVDVPDKHPHLHDAASSALWVVSVYAVLFIGVAFCPGPLGETIRLYFQDCLRDANLSGDVETTRGLLTFIASMVAAYATIPVAVMSCSFLSTKKTNYILASSEGILTPCEAKTLIGYPPLFQWDKLKRISLEKADNEKERYLKFSFDKGSPLKLKVSETKSDPLMALLNAADDYSKRCLIEKPVLDLRKALNDETKAQTMAETKRFSSTVFSLLKPGDELRGAYRIVRKLAGKSLSAVYLARDAANELVIIKEFVLPESVDACDKLDADFKREYTTLKALQHPGIAKIIESFEDRNAKYLVIEHIAGTDLRDLVAKNGTRSEAAVKQLALSIASIMNYLHGQSPAILHRDLTPDNLMISNEGALKLIDFGASHQFIEGVTGTLIGKQCYIAPEQLRGKASFQSDIYSFGGTLYFLLTGTDPRALQQSTLEADADPLLRELIQKCTEFEPQNRLHSFADVIAFIEQSNTDAVPNLEVRYGN